MANKDIRTEIGTMLAEFELTDSELDFAIVFYTTATSLYAGRSGDKNLKNEGAELLVNTLKNMIGTILSLAKMGKK